MILECNCLRIRSLKNIRMKKIGVVLVASSISMGFGIDFFLDEKDIEPFVGLSFGCFLMGIYFLIISKDEIFRS
jgi:hypothetical protein